MEQILLARTSRWEVLRRGQAKFSSSAERCLQLAGTHVQCRACKKKTGQQALASLWSCVEDHAAHRSRNGTESLAASVKPNLRAVKSVVRWRSNLGRKGAGVNKTHTLKLGEFQEEYG